MVKRGTAQVALDEVLTRGTLEEIQETLQQGFAIGLDRAVLNDATDHLNNFKLRQQELKAALHTAVKSKSIPSIRSAIAECVDARIEGSMLEEASQVLAHLEQKESARSALKVCIGEEAVDLQVLRAAVEECKRTGEDDGELVAHALQLIDRSEQKSQADRRAFQKEAAERALQIAMSEKTGDDPDALLAAIKQARFADADPALLREAANKLRRSEQNAEIDRALREAGAS